MLNLCLFKNGHSFPILLDENFRNLNEIFLVATYRQLAIASGRLITIYDLSTTLFGEPFSNNYEKIEAPNTVLALASTIDRIIYLYQSNNDPTKILISSINDQERIREISIPSFKIDEPIYLCALDDGTIFIGYEREIYCDSGEKWTMDNKIKKLVCGKEHILVLLVNGQILSWGNGLHGSLGHGDLEPCLKPTLIEVLGDTVADIAAGGWHSLGQYSPTLS